MSFKATCDKCDKECPMPARYSMPRGWHEVSVHLDGVADNTCGVGIFCDTCLEAVGLRSTDCRPHVSESVAERLYDLIVEIIHENTEEGND